MIEDDDNNRRGYTEEEWVEIVKENYERLSKVKSADENVNNPPASSSSNHNHSNAHSPPSSLRPAT